MLRVCHPHDFDGFNYVNDETGRLGGPLGHIINNGLDFVEQFTQARALNASVVIQRSTMFNVTNANSDNYEGCLYALQSNRSDAYVGLVEYPQNIADVSQGLVVLEASLMIGSMYTKESSEPTQVLSSFAAFSISVWLMCLVNLLCLSMLLRLRNSMRRKRFYRNNYNLLYTLTHMVRLNRIRDDGFARKILFLSASVYSLIVIHCFYSSIKTELVTIKDPKVFRSYQDIINRGAMPHFARGMTYDLPFKRQDAPWYRKKLWQYSVDTFGEEEIYAELDPASFLVGAFGVLMQKSIVILDSLVMPIVPNTGCSIASRDPESFVAVANRLNDPNDSIVLSLSTQHEASQRKLSQRFFERFPNLHLESMPDFNFFTSIDPNENHYTLGVLLGKDVTARLGWLSKWFRAVIESGLELVMRDEIKSINMLDGLGNEITGIFGAKNRLRLHLVQECSSCRIIKPDLGFHPLRLQNFFSLLKLMAAAVPILFLVLAIEKISNFCKFNVRLVSFGRIAR